MNDSQQTRMLTEREKAALRARMEKALAALAPAGSEAAAIGDYVHFGTGPCVCGPRGGSRSEHPEPAHGERSPQGEREPMRRVGDHNAGELLLQVTEDLEMEARIRRTFDADKYASTLTVAGKEALYDRAGALAREVLAARGYGPDTAITAAEYARVRKDCIMAITGAVEPMPLLPAPAQVSPPAPEAAPKKRRKKPPKVLTEKQAAEFAEFWRTYPKKKNKGDAEKAWKKLAPNGELRARILGAISQQKMSPEWLKENGQYIPYPSKWLNAKGWEDEPEPPPGTPPPQRTGTNPFLRADL